MSTLKTIKSSLKRSYDKQNLTLVVIHMKDHSYKILCIHVQFECFFYVVILGFSVNRSVEKPSQQYSTVSCLRSCGEKPPPPLTPPTLLPWRLWKRLSNVWRQLLLLLLRLAGKITPDVVCSFLSKRQRC